MSVIGYARVSTTDQDTSVQVKALEAAGCTKIFHEQITGNTRDRDQLAAALDYVREGDTLLVTRVDRLARSALDLLNIVSELKDKGVTFKAVEQPFDTSDSMGEFFLVVLAAVAQLETSMRRERQAEGIAKARKEGKYKGGKTIDVDLDQVAEKLSQGVPKAKIARDMGISRSTLFRALKKS